MAQSQSLIINIKANASEADQVAANTKKRFEEMGQAVKKINIDTRETTKSMKASAIDAAASQMRAEFGKLGQAVARATADVKAKGEALRGLGSGMSEVSGSAKDLGKSIQDVGEAANHVNINLNGSRQQLLAVGVAANLLTGTIRKLASQWHEVLDTTLSLESAQRVLNHSVNDGAAAFEWVKEKALKYGLEVKTLAHDYGLFMAAAQGSTITAAEAEDIFESFTFTVSALGLSADNAGRMFYALREMMSKGKVYSQDYIRQIGTFLPGAVSRAARAMGISVEDFFKKLRDGEVLAKDLLPKLAKVLREDFYDASLEAAHALQGSMNKFKDSLQLFYYEMGRGGGSGSKGVASVFDEFHKKLREPAMLASARQLGDTIAGFAKLFEWTTKGVMEFRYALTGLAITYGVLKGFNWAATIGRDTAAKFQAANATKMLAGVTKVEEAAKRSNIVVTKLDALARLDNAKSIELNTMAKIRAERASRVRDWN